MSDGTRTGPVRVLLYVPNLVGYVRIALFVAGMIAGTGNAEAAAWLFIACFSLDFFDGYLARKLHQTSAFGALIDVLIDNFARGALWCWGADGPWLCMIPLMEMTVCVCTHKGGGAAWRTGCFARAPWWVEMVMKNGFRSPAGILAILGLMGCPLWLWSTRWLPGTLYSSAWVGAVVIPGRCVAAAVEMWVVVSHLGGILQEDAVARDSKRLE